MYTHSYDGQDSHLCNKANNMSFTLYVNQGLVLYVQNPFCLVISYSRYWVIDDKRRGSPSHGFLGDVLVRIWATTQRSVN